MGRGVLEHDHVHDAQLLGSGQVPARAGRPRRGRRERMHGVLTGDGVGEREVCRVCTTAHRLVRGGHMATCGCAV
eukprot:6053857-Prymnesium_polylepis.1